VSLLGLGVSLLNLGNFTKTQFISLIMSLLRLPVSFVAGQQSSESKSSTSITKIDENQINRIRVQIPLSLNQLNNFSCSDSFFKHLFMSGSKEAAKYKVIPEYCFR
jgi:hypothetical protein